MIFRAKNWSFCAPGGAVNECAKKLMANSRDYAGGQGFRRIVKNKSFAKFTPHDLRRTAATLAQSLRVPRDHVKALLNHKDGDVTAIYARWHMFEEKREAALAIEGAVSPLMSASGGAGNSLAPSLVQ
jgi:integrase